ncbi:SDR family NAD(P)-dependent oxidoreductase [Streptomyces rectiverticillatus]|uniref:type I polyketide synthase n=1 Tax=Streptomyces rectiverticillatus TaxID=173860 RepID=UPI0015C3137E|nr:type I polyketide synthase [Streptomyces rectiverticillatus]QLE74806.1 SDR family NAD(P)-dependent oxidoreductase [Streptomyces rectiverticillatus]
MEHTASRSVASPDPSVPLAVVGAACRLPGGITDLGGLWTALAEGRDLISPAPPADRIDAARFCDPDAERPGKAYTMAGGYLGDVSGFDPEYFGISPREAKHMDPQQRMLLEMTAEALDDAAVDAASLAGSDTAVFVGISDMSYGAMQMARAEEISAYSMSGSALSIAANRLSYVFDLRGPSIAVDTACSSSLTAVHQACETLRSGRSRVALAGGANVLLSPYHFIGFSRATMLSPRGRCATFSAGADGYVRAEGGGMVVLKRLPDALADGDRVHAVIVGSGANCDGSTSAMTVPSTEMQQRLLREVYERAGSGPDQVLYFEAHGTGTPVGDPLECRAVGAALGVPRTNGPLPIGSVKTNMGHAEPASGMAGLFKGMLVLRHGRIPASLHGEPLNPQIDFAGLNLCPVGSMRPVAALGDGGVVGVNSFGFGGANAHVVLGAAPQRQRAAAPVRQGPLPLVVSGRTRRALAEAARAVAAHVRDVPEEDFYDLCWTASRRRTRHPHRAAVMADGPEDAAVQLEALAGEETAQAAASVHTERPPSGGTVFVFCGNGTQWPGMGAELMAREPVFRTAVEEANRHLEPLLGWSVAKLLTEGPREKTAGTAGTAGSGAESESDAAPAAENRSDATEAAESGTGTAADAGSAEHGPGVAADAKSGSGAAAETENRPGTAADAENPSDAAADAEGESRAAADAESGPGEAADTENRSDAATDAKSRTGAAADAENGPGTAADAENPSDAAAGAAGGAEEPSGVGRGGRMADTAFGQPALFAFQIGLVALLAEYGTVPAAVLGHSVGEVAAAYVSGALDLPGAARVIAERSRAQAATAGTGRMAAIGLGEEKAREAIAAYEGLLEIAAVNSARDVTVSGQPAALRSLARELAAREVPFRELGVDHGFHSAAMDPIEEPLRAGLAGLVAHRPRLPMYSTVTGGPVTDGQLDAAYWWHNARRPVRFAEAVAQAAGAGIAAVVEIAPQPGLAGVLNRIASETPGGPFPVVSPVTRERCDGAAVRRAAARLLAAGDAGAAEPWFPGPGSVADLPPYPWQREPYWHGTPEHWVRTSGDGVLVHPLLGERVPVLEPTWHTPVERARTPWLADHRVAGSVVMPATGFVELALAAGREVFGGPAEIDDLEITRALPLTWDAEMDVRLQTSLSDEDGVVRIASRTGDTGGWRLHARGRVRRLAAARPEPVDAARTRERLCGRVTGDEHYAAVAAAGLEYGPAFRVLRELRTGDGEVLAVYHCDPPDDGYGGYVVHPALLDGALQAGAPLLADAETGYLPSAVDGLRQWARPAPVGLVHVRQRSRTSREAVWDITVTGEDGEVALELTGCRLQRLPLRATDGGKEYVSVLRAAPLPGQPAPAWAPPSPGDVAAAAEEELERLRAWPSIERYGEGHAYLQYVTGTAAARAFAELLPGQDAFTVGDLLTAGVLPQYEKLVRLLARMAVQEGLLTPDGEGWRRLRAARMPDLQEVSRFADYLPLSSLNLRFGTHLPDVLRGRRDPLELLFQDSGPELVQQFYDVNPPVRFHNRVTAGLLAALIRAWPADRPLRILEVGAGTGGLTVHLLPLLDARVQYVFSDVSAAFLSAAQARLAARHPVEYRVLDLDTDPEEQGFTAGSFDVVVAGFALHTATDLRAALRRVARLIAPGGHLLALELHDPGVIALLFTTLEGFWRAGDPGLRPDSILLPREQWPDVLTQCGFLDVTQVGAASPPLSEQFSVLLARTPVTAGAAAALPAGPPARDSWILVTEEDTESAMAAHVAAELTAAGCATAHVVPLPAGAEAWRDVLGKARSAAVALLLSSAPDRAAGPGPAACTELAVRRAAALRSLAMALQGEGPRHFVLVTHPSGALPSPERPAHPGQAVAWGVTRTLANESATAVRRISLDRGPDLAEDAARLARELLATAPRDGQDEDEVALTRGGRFVHRFERAVPLTEPAVPGGGVRYRLHLQDPGLAFGLRWTETSVADPGPGEVVVAVRAAALNYRDVMVATGLLPPVAEDGIPSEDHLGLEGAGVVTAVGEGVEDLAVGDRVFGPFPGAFASHVRIPAAALRPVPGDLTFAEAATLPAVFFTVHHSLEHLARLRPGETLLVHGAAGGVGMAASQYARRIGARIIATAGSPAKRDLALASGAELALDSRTHAFADLVRAHTGGRGVDVVLNSLSGEAAARSRELLAPCGRFIELGKRDVLGNQRLLQKALADNTTHCVVDVANLTWQAPAHAGAVFDEVLARVRAGDYLPLPHVAYPAHRIEEAFRLLQHSKHLGKIVITFDEPVPVHRSPRPLRLDSGGTYLVTGGLSGFGAETARWLAAHGARRLDLVSRRGAAADGAEELLAGLLAQGVAARAHAVDVSDADAVRRLLADIEASGHPVQGVVHAAMHLDDAVLTELTEDRIRSVLAPKWTGALLLDELCPQADFTVYSSAGAALGVPGQASYVAANLAMEALVRARRAAGRPGLAVAWGAIGRVGYVARNNLIPALSAGGGSPVEPREGLAALERLLAGQAEWAAVAHLDWGRIPALCPGVNSPRFASVLPAAQDTAWQLEELLGQLAGATPAEAFLIVEDLITSMVADTLRMPLEEVDRHRPLQQYGMDSLMGMEMFAELRKRLNQEVPVMELLHSDGSIHGISETVLPHLLRQARAGTPPGALPGALPGAPRAVPADGQAGEE